MMKYLIILLSLLVGFQYSVSAQPNTDEGEICIVVETGFNCPDLNGCTELDQFVNSANIDNNILTIKDKGGNDLVNYDFKNLQGITFQKEDGSTFKADGQTTLRTIANNGAKLNFDDVNNVVTLTFETDYVDRTSAISDNDKVLVKSENTSNVEYYTLLDIKDFVGGLSDAPAFDITTINCSMSSVPVNSRNCDKLTDGDTGTFIQTNNETNPWVEFDVQYSYFIKSMTFTNRIGGGQANYFGGYVHVSNTPFDVNASLGDLISNPNIRNINIINEYGDLNEITVPINAKARYIRFQHSSSTGLSLAETTFDIDLFATNSDAPATPEITINGVTGSDFNLPIPSVQNSNANIKIIGSGNSIHTNPHVRETSDFIENNSNLQTTWVNTSVSGRNINVINNNASAEIDTEIDPAFDENIVILYELINAYSQYTKSPDVMMSEYIAFCEGRLAAGVDKVWIVTSYMANKTVNNDAPYHEYEPFRQEITRRLVKYALRTPNVYISNAGAIPEVGSWNEFRVNAPDGIHVTNTDAIFRMAHETGQDIIDAYNGVDQTNSAIFFENQLLFKPNDKPNLRCFTNGNCLNVVTFEIEEYSN